MSIEQLIDHFKTYTGEVKKAHSHLKNEKLWLYLQTLRMEESYARFKEDYQKELDKTNLNIKDLIEITGVIPFHSGKIQFSSSVMREAEVDSSFNDFIHDGLYRHLSCDWGDVSDDVKAKNDHYSPVRLLSRYDHQEDEKYTINILTEADRSTTTILLNSELYKYEEGYQHLLEQFNLLAAYIKDSYSDLKEDDYCLYSRTIRNEREYARFESKYAHRMAEYRVTIRDLLKDAGVIRFESGSVYNTSAIHTQMQEERAFAKFVHKSLSRHLDCDWGDLAEEDKQANMNSLDRYSRLLSHYKYDASTSIYIITEADRSSTTILFSEEY